MLDSVTLDQLRMLVAVADAGSFTAAAKRVQRAQSAVSHAIATLEEQLDVQLFDRSTKRPTFTPHGEAILAEARMVLVRAERLRATARGLAAGMEGDVTLATGVIVPEEPLVRTFDKFRHAFPLVALRVFREEVGGAPDLVARGIADLGFAGAQSLAPFAEDVFDRSAIGEAEVVTVAGAKHPLALLDRPLSDSDLADHRQITPTSRVAKNFEHTLVHDVWEVADLALRHRIIREGMAWGTLPLEVAKPSLADGHLVRLRIQARPEHALRVPLFAISRTGDAVGPARRWLVETMRAELAGSP
ncbi:MAG: LysR family transcriptional regulator [Pseudomonadota bacterium]